MKRTMWNEKWGKWLSLLLIFVVLAVYAVAASLAEENIPAAEQEETAEELEELTEAIMEELVEEEGGEDIEATENNAAAGQAEEEEEQEVADDSDPAEESAKEALADSLSETDNLSAADGETEGGDGDAEEEEEEPTDWDALREQYDYVIDYDSVTAAGEGYTYASSLITLNQSDASYLVYSESGTTQAKRIYISGADTEVTLRNVHITTSAGYGMAIAAVTTDLIIEEENVVITSNSTAAGFAVTYNGTLNIDGTGSLDVRCNGTYGAGIGGGRTANVGYINGGTVYAKGGGASGGTINTTNGGAGIGSGHNNKGTVIVQGITINGGNVYAESGVRAAATGSGKTDSGKTTVNYIRIHGGEVECQSGTWGAGIGTGGATNSSAYFTNVTEITISGGKVKCNYAMAGGGIGAGTYSGAGSATIGSINISGGEIYTAGYTGIGSGDWSGNSKIIFSTINITGGEILTVGGQGHGIGWATNGYNPSAGSATFSKITISKEAHVAAVSRVTNAIIPRTLNDSDNTYIASFLLKSGLRPSVATLIEAAGITDETLISQMTDDNPSTYPYFALTVPEKTVKAKAIYDIYELEDLERPLITDATEEEEFTVTPGVVAAATTVKFRNFLIHYDANGGEGTNTDVWDPLRTYSVLQDGSGFSYENDAGLPGKLIGWNANAAGTGTVYQLGQEFDDGDGFDTDTVLYAVWAEPMQVLYDANTDDPSVMDMPSDKNCYYVWKNGYGEGDEEDHIAAVPDGKPQREGYQFTGWNTKADGTGTDYEAGDEISLTVSTTLYAQWESMDYELSYDLNGGIQRSRFPHQKM